MIMWCGAAVAVLALVMVLAGHNPMDHMRHHGSDR
jgi:hypothetical protein